MPPAAPTDMHRVLAAVAAVLALVAGGVPVASAMPARCAECCHQAATHAAEAAMPDCCQMAPVPRPVGRQTAARVTGAPPSIAVPLRISAHLRADRVPPDLPPPDARRPVVGMEVLRI